MNLHEWAKNTPVRWSKYFPVAICVIMGAGGFSIGGGLGDVFGAGMLIIAFFLMTVAQVQLGAHELKYRRWSRWHAVPYSEIEACAEDSQLGYVKLRRYVFPWGKIYFMLPPSSESLTGRDMRLVNAIREKANSH